MNQTILTVTCLGTNKNYIWEHLVQLVNYQIFYTIYNIIFIYYYSMSPISLNLYYDWMDIPMSYIF